MSSRRSLPLALGLLLLPAAGIAGTGRLLSPWMSRAPELDGQISAAEWTEAKLVDLGAGVTLRLGNDGRTLYLALLDSGDPTAGAGDALQLYFDDEGGTVPVLDDDLYGAAACQHSPELGEGALSFAGSIVDFHEFSQTGQCPAQPVVATGFRSAARPEGLTYELAVPLDGPAPLRAGAGRRFGVHLRLFRAGVAVACLPDCTVLNPPEFRNLVLASGGCNTGPQRFGSGAPAVGLPLDWTAELALGGGVGWEQSGLDGDQYYCGYNVTGGSGAAACAADVHYTTTAAQARLFMPTSLAAQGTASLRFWVNFQSGAPDDFFSLFYQFADGSTPFGSTIYGDLGEPGGPGYLIETPLPSQGTLPVNVIFGHGTSVGGGLDGGFAQLDDVELSCGPLLFADGFDSGLTTHWSASVD